MVTKEPEVVHVLDSCIWIELIRYHPEFCRRLIDLARLDVLKIGVPDIVRDEVRANKDVLHELKKNWKSRIGELKRLAEAIDGESRLGSSSATLDAPKTSFVLSLRQLSEGLKTFDGDPVRDAVTDFLCSKRAIQIPTPRAIYEEVIEWGLLKKKPFGNNNVSTRQLTSR